MTPSTSALMSHFIELMLKFFFFLFPSSFLSSFSLGTNLYLKRWFKANGEFLVLDEEFDAALLSATNRLPFLDWSALMKMRFLSFLLLRGLKTFLNT